MISPTQRRSGIPVSTASTRRLSGDHQSALGGRRSLSRSKDTLLNHPADLKRTTINGATSKIQSQSSQQTSSQHSQLNTDVDLRTFTLLEENITLKESVEQLGRLRAEQQQLHATLLAQLSAVRSQCEQLHRSEATWRAQVKQDRIQEQQQHKLNTSTKPSAGTADEAAITTDAEATVRAQLASTELQLYEANEKCADLTEENGRLQEECDSVTALARLTCDEAVRALSGQSTNMVALLRAVKTQREIYARVARTTVDSQALLSSALQLMDTTAVVKEKTARNDDAEKLARQPSPSIDDNTSRMGVGSSETGGRTVQMYPKGSAVNVAAAAVRSERPPPPPVPPRHYNTAHMSGSLGDGRQQQQQQQRCNILPPQQSSTIPNAVPVDVAISSSGGLRLPNGPDLNPISGVLHSQQQRPHVSHRPYQTVPMATDMDALTTIPNRRHVIVEVSTHPQQEDTIFV